jgi:hypothetical protein
MGKYTSSARRPPAPKRDRIPPLVRGIGCLLFVLVPILGYGIASVIAPMAPGWGLPVPPEWYGPTTIRNPVSGIPYLNEFVDLMLQQDNLIANLVFAVIVTVLLFGVLSIAYGYVYSMAAPSQLGPTDVPHPRVKTKKYRR